MTGASPPELVSPRGDDKPKPRAQPRMQGSRAGGDHRPHQPRRLRESLSPGAECRSAIWCTLQACVLFSINILNAVLNIMQTKNSSKCGRDLHYWFSASFLQNTESVISLLFVSHFKRSVSLKIVQNEMQTFFFSFKECINPAKQVNFTDSIFKKNTIIL